MRTTVDLDKDVVSAARELARERGESLGTVLSALARAGLRPRAVDRIDGLRVIRATATSPLITSEMVRRALDDE